MYDPFEARKWGRVALIVLYVPICSHRHGQVVVVRAHPRSIASLTVSISMTVLKPFSDNLAIGARKFPAAPVIGERKS